MERIWEKLHYKVAFKIKWDDEYTDVLAHCLDRYRFSKNISYDYYFICGSGTELPRILWSHRISKVPGVYTV